MKIFLTITFFYVGAIMLFSCKLIKPVFYNLPDEKDAKRFPYQTIMQAPDSAIFYFKKITEIPDEINRSVAACFDY